MEQNEVERNSPDSDIIVNIDKSSDTFLHSGYAKNNMGSGDFKPDLIEKAFYIWYSNGRPGFIKTKDLLKERLLDEELPNDWSLREWITDFNARAYELDKRVHEQVEALVIAEKVEMMRRHAQTSVVMQDMAIKYLKSHETELVPASAIRLLVEGIRIERESRGIPEALEKMVRMTDEEILDEIKELVTSSTVTIEDIDANP